MIITIMIKIPENSSKEDYIRDINLRKELQETLIFFIFLISVKLDYCFEFRIEKLRINK